ncbi:MAG: hypothetical protein WA755_05570 [Candidatus Acidiferrales bacterium]
MRQIYESRRHSVTAIRGKLFSFGRFMWKGDLEEAKKPVPHWFHFGLQLVVVGFVLYWHRNVPAPNKAVLALAACAALMVFAEMRPVHKAIYCILIVALVFTENHAIDKDRADFARDEACRRQEENQQFSKIGNAITTNVGKLLEHSDQEFANTIAKSDAIMSGVTDSIKTQTGGNSFAFIDFTAEPAQAFEMRWNDFVAPRGEPYFLVSITSRGKYPLRGTHAIMMDDERRLAVMQEYNKHPNGNWIKAINSVDSEYQMPYLRPQSVEAPQGEVDIIGLYPMPQADSKRLTINFSAPNGYWNEVLHLGRVNGNWRQCLSVMGPTAKQAQHPFVYCDSDWPEGKKLAEKDWAFTPPKKQ